MPWPFDLFRPSPSLFLKALSVVYAAGEIASRCLKTSAAQKASRPVISIGSPLVGGSGKTPITLMIADILKEEGYRPVCITRGYKGAFKGPLQVDPSYHTAYEVGDEALLLAQVMPTYLSRKRCDALKILSSCDKTIILLDDGHQHFSLYKDLSFLVMNEQQGLGNGYLLPAGPLREPYTEAAKRADALLWIGSEIQDRISRSEVDLPCFPIEASFSCSLPAFSPVIAFSGLGYPQRFEDSLKKLDVRLLHHYLFPDHHAYTPLEEIDLLRHAKATDATLVTTSKDWVKLSKGFQSKVVVVHQTLSATPAFRSFLKEALC